jgi:hypothetical protein
MVRVRKKDIKNWNYFRWQIVKQKKKIVYLILYTMYIWDRVF